jgi:hypothetical protein
MSIQPKSLNGMQTLGMIIYGHNEAKLAETDIVGWVVGNRCERDTLSTRSA